MSEPRSEPTMRVSTSLGLSSLIRGERAHGFCSTPLSYRAGRTRLALSHRVLSIASNAYASCAEPWLHDCFRYPRRAIQHWPIQT